MRHLLPAALAGLALAGAAEPSDAAAGRSACQKLRGKDLAPARTVKLVVRSHDEFVEEQELLGCVLPRGKVRLIASGSEGETHGESFSVMHVAGAFVATSSSFGNQYGWSSGAKVTSIRTGRSYSVASAGCSISDSCTAGFSARRVLITRNGRAAAALSDGATTRIEAFSSTGAQTDLDSGPADQVLADSLRLSGVTVSWTGTGGPRTATLPRD